MHKQRAHINRYERKKEYSPVYLRWKYRHEFTPAVTSAGGSNYCRLLLFTFIYLFMYLFLFVYHKSKTGCSRKAKVTVQRSLESLPFKLVRLIRSTAVAEHLCERRVLEQPETHLSSARAKNPQWQLINDKSQSEHRLTGAHPASSPDDGKRGPRLPSLGTGEEMLRDDLQSPRQLNDSLTSLWMTKALRFAR